MRHASRMRDKMHTSLTQARDRSMTAQKSDRLQQGVVVLISLMMLAGCSSKSQPAQRSNASVEPATVQTPPLLEKRWRIYQLGRSKMQSFSEAPVLVFAVKNQQLWGSTGCNRLTGNYVLGPAGELTIRASMSRLNCEGALAQEAKILDALDQTRSYQLTGQMLRLLDGRNQVVLLAQIY
jgi:heat shock protein HslJ